MHSFFVVTIIVICVYTNAFSTDKDIEERIEDLNEGYFPESFEAAKDGYQDLLMKMGDIEKVEVDPKCVDKFPARHCVGQVKFCNSNDYPLGPRARRNCAKTCGVCQTNDGGDGKNPKCVDKKSPEYCLRQIDFCKSNDDTLGPRARENCAATCEACEKNDGGGEKHDCVDKLPARLCVGQLKFCNSNDYPLGPRARRNCAKSCGVCPTKVY